ncbi:hypothetical protein CQW23_01621 [Capsicum baccatum]|uniref:RNase H type-1 domain-containing protein n=1 Tax=Capsicum baccatum TaxID=33114 RepID=A0A2G2XP48_CAPBA|nr:hypothetical protein CQW23_01621 [Capsicum baccatum]
MRVIYKGPLAILYPDHERNNNAKVMDYIDRGNWNMDKLREDLPEHIVLYIANIPIGDANENDCAFWNITQDDQYTNSSAWQSIREVRQKDGIVSKTKFWTTRMEVQFYGTSKQLSISVAFPTCDLTGRWFQICSRIKRYRPIVRWWQVVWTKPMTGRITFNTDGSYIQESTSIAGIGGVLRDDIGNLIMAFSVPIQCKSNNQVEAMTSLYAMKWCTEAGYDKYDLGMDSMVVTNLLKGKDTNNLKLKFLTSKTIEGADVIISH